ncbi:E3 ubiquitin-protein ligase RNF135-like [Protopterus annectens]|uniref:E3 ubiquitin-protein ligase RNF135-like n=1 Tax=Protopterus annectens TaxID=7888 RepID=UPI001CFB29FE|nr:E3 ubiquitin-protein ligase RNF135-like [Protopterus annectens]
MAEQLVGEDLNCSICLDLFSDPVTLECQHTFCKGCIKKTWKEQRHVSSSAYRCPLCNREFDREPELNTINPTLRSLAEKVKAKQNASAEAEWCRREPAAGIQTEDLGEERCEVHGELLQLLCLSHSWRAICLQGSSKQHGRCQIVSLAEWKDKQEQLNEKITQVTCRIEDHEKVILQREQEKNLLKESVSSVKASLIDEFAVLKQCIEEQEKAVLKSIDAEDKVLYCRLQSNITQTTMLIERLKNVRAKLEEKMKNNTWDLSQDISSDIEICENESSLDTSLFLDKNKIEAIRDAVEKLRGQFLESDLQKLILLEEDEKPVACSQQGTDFFCSAESPSNHPKIINPFQQFATKLTFDRMTNYKRLQISKDGRVATVSGKDVQCFPSPKRFKVNQVFCEQGFSSECHFWKVIAKHSGGWAFGISYDDLGRREFLGRNSKSWCLEWSERHLSVWHENQRKILKDYTEPTVVGVLLDCNAGLLKFYCVNKTEFQLLHTYDNEFTRPVYPAFWLYGLMKGSYLELIDMEKD